jgi:CMP-N,N'-diacetyllegionaminic acid synthase
VICEKTITCFIPAKGQSTRLPGKNVRLCDGWPLVNYPIDIADTCLIFDAIVVSTDDMEVGMVSQDTATDVSLHIRPPELCLPTSNVWDAVKHYTEQRYDERTDYICLLHPTSPCLLPETVVVGIRMMIESGHESLISVSKASPYHFNAMSRPDFSVTTGTQFEDEHYCLNNAIHVIPWDAAAEGKSIYSTDWIIYPTPADESIDIDNEDDLEMAEAILQWRQHEDKKPISGTL